jgi:hypothetical protein
VKKTGEACSPEPNEHGAPPVEASEVVSPGGIVRPTDAMAPSPRSVLLAQLTAAIAFAVEAGDHEGARIAHDALGRLLASAAQTPAGIVPFTRGRSERR